MAADRHENSNDLNALIAESEQEVQVDSAIAESNAASSWQVRHPGAVLLAWLVLATVGLSIYLDPLPTQRDLGIRSVETRVSVAMYHVAHRVETYRRLNGHLPEYLEPQWHEAGTVEYERDGDGYRLTGREGEFRLIYNDGDDSERLLHYLFLKLGGQ